SDRRAASRPAETPRAGWRRRQDRNRRRAERPAPRGRLEQSAPPLRRPPERRPAPPLAAARSRPGLRRPAARTLSPGSGALDGAAVQRHTEAVLDLAGQLGPGALGRRVAQERGDLAGDLGGALAPPPLVD